MFKQGCYIRKNTKELRDKLEKLGYENKLFHINNDDYCIICSIDSNYYTSRSDDYNGEFDGSLKGLIDCGTNEDLFLAIASLRDDINKNQWFIWDDKEDKGEIWKLYDDNPNWSWWVFETHKATVDELVNHFKNNL
jgi:hypothetical protein